MKYKIKLSIFWLSSFIVIIFMMTFSAHAQGLPVYVDNDSFTSVYGYSAAEFINVCNSSRFFQSNGINIDIDTPGLVMFNGIENGYAFTEIFVPTTSYSGDFPTTGGVTYNTWNSDDNYLTLSSTYFYYYLYERGELWQAQLYYYGSGTQNLNYSFYGSTGLEIGYLSSDYNWSIDPSLKIATNISIPVIDVGVAIVPPTPIIPEYPTGTTPPANVPPTYNPQSYTPTTPPTPDFSTAEKILESIYNYIVWAISDINGQFNLLKDNLVGFFEYIGATIQYYGNMIIQTLNNLIQNFYDNMKSLVENIGNNIVYAVEPLDPDIIHDNISTTSIVTNIGIIQTSLTSFQASFTGVSEPSSYTIPIHLENLPSNWFGNQTTQYIDLGVINGTVKDGLRIFVWAMVTYSLVVTIFDSISNYINGGGDES